MGNAYGFRDTKELSCVHTRTIAETRRHPEATGQFPLDVLRRWSFVSHESRVTTASLKCPLDISVDFPRVSQQDLGVTVYAPCHSKTPSYISMRCADI